MNIKDNLFVELDGLGEFEFEVEIQLEIEYDDFTGSNYKTCGLVDCELEGRNTETGEVLSFSPEIFDILEDNFDAGNWITDYLFNKREDSYDLGEISDDFSLHDG